MAREWITGTSANRAKVQAAVRIEVENLSPLSDFTTLRDELIRRGDRFAPYTLTKIPYEQLFLCCTGDALGARCDRQLVVNERRARRRRFLHQETDEQAASERYLLVNQMTDDVRYDQGMATAPKWDDLKARQKVWAKLNCIYNHIDAPYIRLGEAILLLRDCTLSRELPPEVAKSYMPRLRGLQTIYPGRVTDSIFRSKIGEIAESLFEFLPDEEAQVVAFEAIQGYSCSSDCYRIVV